MSETGPGLPPYASQASLTSGTHMVAAQRGLDGGAASADQSRMHALFKGQELVHPLFVAGMPWVGWG